MAGAGAVSVTLACTLKLRKLLGRTEAPVGSVGASTAVEFYANLLWLDGRKCLLVAEAKTLFCFLVADVLKRDLAPIGEFFVSHLASELAAEGLPRDLFGSIDSGDVHVVPTRDRVVLGSLVEFGRMCEYRVDDSGGLDRTDIAALNHWLRRIPMGRRQRTYIHPIEAARALQPKLDEGRQLLGEWEAEHGAITEQELARARTGRSGWASLALNMPPGTGPY